MRLDQSPIAVEEQPATTTSDPPRADDLIIKEARRRHRRRLLGASTVVAVFLGLIAFGTATILGGSPHRSSGRTASTRLPPQPPALSSCSTDQLAATVAFNQSGTDLGAIKLTNTSARPCSLSGQPKVVIINGSGSALGENETVFQRAGLPPPFPPTQAIALSANRQLPQAVVELEWDWCGAPPGSIQFKIQFSGWPQALTVPYSAISPSGFVPENCNDSGLRPLLAVDGVRGLGQDGIVTAGAWDRQVRHFAEPSHRPDRGGYPQRAAARWHSLPADGIFT
jgi:Protein of unknown function (DUF4232)